MKITSASGQLTLRDTPGCFWLFGLFFMGVGVPFMAGPLGLFTNNDEVSWPLKVFSFVMGCLAVTTGGYVIYGAPLTVIVFDLFKGEVVIRQRGLFRNSTSRHTLAEIKSVGISEKEDSDGDPVYQPYLALKNQQTVPLSLLWIHDKKRSEDVVVALQGFLGLQKR